MPVSRTHACPSHGSRLRAPNTTGILNNRSRATKATGSWKSSRSTSKLSSAAGMACLFCNHETAVQVKVDKKAGTGEAVCKNCGQDFHTAVNYLSVAADVYADWVDACESVKDSKDGLPVDKYGSMKIKQQLARQQQELARDRAYDRRIEQFQREDPLKNQRQPEQQRDLMRQKELKRQQELDVPACSPSSGGLEIDESAMSDVDSLFG